MSELTTLQILMLEQEIQAIGESIMEMHKSYKSVLSEGVDDFLSDDADLGFMFDEAKKRFQAAKKGLALTNKLPDPVQRKENRSRVMGNLNKLRAIETRLRKAIENLIQSAQTGAQNRDIFQQAPASNGVVDRFRSTPQQPQAAQ